MLLPQLIRNQKGYAMALALLAVGAAGALAVYFMQSAERAGSSNVRDMQTFDRENLRSDLRMILANESNCRMSVTGEFYKSKTSLKDKHQGLPVEVWVTDGIKKLRSRVKDGDLYYTLKIKSVRLFMDHGDPLKEMLPGITSELGTLRVKYNVADGGDNVLDLPLRVTAETDLVGKSTILSCQLPVDQAHCEGAGMTYDEKSGICDYDVTCSEWTELADAHDEWSGEASDKCWDNYGSHLREITFSQGQPDHGVNIESNGMLVRCCFPRNMMTVQCFDFETAADPVSWEGNKEAFCNMQEGGLMNGLIFSQRKTEAGPEVNGLMIRCCYPW